MKRIVAFFSMLAIIYLVLPNSGVPGTSQEERKKASMPAPAKMEHTSSTDAFKKDVVAKHVRAEFQIMSLASMNMKGSEGATHHVMVKLYDNKAKQPVKVAVGKVKVIGPDKNEQVNSLKSYNGILAANFIFDKKGKYGIICLVKISGEKHLFKFWYPHE